MPVRTKFLDDPTKMLTVAGVLFAALLGMAMYGAIKIDREKSECERSECPTGVARMVKVQGHNGSECICVVPVKR